MTDRPNEIIIMAVTSRAESPELLDRQDYDMQIEAASRSVEAGHYATARAELRGAVWILTAIERRYNPPKTDSLPRQRDH